MEGKHYDDLTVKAVRKVGPCVVSIGISKYLPRMQDLGPSALFNPFSWGNVEDGAKEKVKVGGGSGFFVHESGLVLTNKHVVFDPDAEYAVVTADGKEFPAKVLSTWKALSVPERWTFTFSTVLAIVWSPARLINRWA